nr:cyclin-dependent kinase inhibitor 1-like [Pogona vitticeps]
MEPKPAKASHARRNLFGPVDHDNLQQDVQNMLWASMERAMQRWNFDFLQDKPTEGLLQWEELPVHEVPTFYHNLVIGQGRYPLQSMNWDVTKETKMSHVGKMMKKTKPAKRIARKKGVAGKKRRQTSLTDYYTAKKDNRVAMRTPVKKLAI